MLKGTLIVIINCAITFVLSTALGYMLARIKAYIEKERKTKKNENMQNLALQTLLKNQLTNVYFVYSELKRIPDYVYQNFLDMLVVYESLDGNGFIHTLAKKMESWEITKTDIL